MAAISTRPHSSRDRLPPSRWPLGERLNVNDPQADSYRYMIPLASPGDRPLSVVKAQLTPGLCGVGREAGSGAGLLLTRRGGIGHLVWPAVEILSVPTVPGRSQDHVPPKVPR